MLRLAAGVLLAAIIPASSAQAAGPVPAVPTSPCSNLGYEQVVGGNNQFPGNPGNPNSSNWVRMYGDRVTFRAPITPTVRTDCYGGAAGILLKMRMVNPNGSLSNAIALVGVMYENESTLHGFQYAVPEWGSAFYTSTPPALDGNWNDVGSTNVTSLCSLAPGQLVTLRITAFTDAKGNNAWRPQCYDGSGWLDMYPGTSYVDNAHNFGVDLMERFRAGSSGGLVIDATNLQEQAVTGAWSSWENSDCYSNNTTGSDTYMFTSVSSSEFTIGSGTPNPNC